MNVRERTRLLRLAAELSAIDVATSSSRGLTGREMLVELARATGRGVVARSRRGRRQQLHDRYVVVVDLHLPGGADSGSQRMRWILAELTAAGYRVHLFGVYGGDDRSVTQLRRARIEVADSFRSACDGVPRGSTYFLSRGDVAAKYLLAARFRDPEARVLFDTVDLHFERYRTAAAIEPDADARKRLQRRAAAYERLELAAAAASDATVVVSDEERTAVRRRLPDAVISVLPTVHAIRPPSVDPRDRRGALFVGNLGHDPNADALRYLIEEVLPHLPPGHRQLTAAGPGTESFSGVTSAGVKVTGRGLVTTAELESLHTSHRVFAAPMRFGAGVKGKVGEALAQGIPVVTTPVGSEGFGVGFAEAAMVAPVDAAAIAGAIEQVLVDDQLWHRLSVRGMQLIADGFTPEAQRENLLNLFAP